MSRPNLVVTWANSGNYPAGSDPWSGRPVAVVPAATFFTPNTKPAAEDFNFLFGNLVADIGAVYKQAGQNAGQNWHQLVSATGNAHFGGAAWDSLKHRWVYGVVGDDGGLSPGIFVEYTKNFTQTPVAFGNPLTTATNQQIQSVLAAKAVPGLYLAGVIDRAGLAGSVYNITTGTFPNWSTSFGPIVNATDIQMIEFNALFIALVAGASGGTRLAHSSTGVGGSWTVDTIPGGFTNILRWRAAASPTSVVAISQQQTSQLNYIRSTDGINWVSRPIGVATGSQQTGVCFCQGPFGPAFIITSTDGSGFGTQTWISYDDGLSFTQIATIANFRAIDIAAMGSLLVIITDEQGFGLTASNYAFSIDGGLTWQNASNFINTGIVYANRYGVDPRVYAGDVGFFSLNSAFQSGSFEQGVPVVNLT